MVTLMDPNDPQEERVFLALRRLQLPHLRDTLAAVLSEAAKEQWTYLEFLDQILRREVDAKQGKRIRMGLQIAHFPCVRTIEGFDFSFQPSADERLIRELSTGNFIAHGENVLIFGPPGVGKSHLAIGLGRKVVEQGHTVRFTTATALLSVLGKAESEGNLGDKLIEYSKPRLLIIDELGYLPFERRAAHLFFQFQLLRKHKYRKRKALKKKTMGPRNPNRNAQFENIARLKKEYLKAGLPVISMDTKKKELLGNFYREGKIDTQETIETNDHDFGSAGVGTVIPHSLYDVGKTRASSTSIPATTPANWPVTVSRRGGRRKAGPTIPRPRNYCCYAMAAAAIARPCICSKKTFRSWRTGLASRFAWPTTRLTARSGIRLSTACPHLTGACRGVIFHTLETVRYYMAKAKTKKGLKVKVSILDKVYETGRKYAAGFKKTMKIVFDEFLPKWNYRAVPQSV